MTETQLYLAIGVPSLLVMLNFVGTLIAILWQARALERSIGIRFDGVGARVDSLNARIDALKEIMNAKFESAQQGLLRVEGVLDARLKHLEERER